MKNKCEIQRVIIIIGHIMASKPYLTQPQADMWKLQSKREKSQPLPTHSVHKGWGATDRVRKMGSQAHSPSPKKRRAQYDIQAPLRQPRTKAQYARLKGQPRKIWKAHCRPSILPLNTCIYPMVVTLTHRSHITPLGPF